MGFARISQPNAVEAVVRSAWRRSVLVLALDQLALAVMLVLFGAVLLLLAGTQILAWWWLAVLGIGGGALAAARIRARKLTRYRAAQIVDRRLCLTDSLSTAWFLLSKEDAQNDPVARFQIEHAAKVAAAVETSRAFPFTGGRNWALTGALAGLVFGLFAVRYLVTSSLDLRQALVPIHFGAIFGASENSRLQENRRIPDLPIPGSQETKIQPAGAQEPSGRNAMSNEVDGGQPDRSSAGQSPAAGRDSQRNNNPQHGPQNGTADASAQQTAEQKAAQTAQSGSGNEASANGQQSTSGLLDKMKDALSSLLAKMRPNGASQRAPQNGEPTPDDQKNGNQSTAANNARQGQQQDARNQQANRERSAEAQAPGQTTEHMQAAQGRNAGQSPENGSDAHSGIGRQDGDKAIKEAEQLRAMGKLAEIIGKRSANLTGDMMVETPSGNQQLKTAYSQRLGQHADLGGEINRDEIPLADRQYIREYMELVHKQEKSQ